MTESGWRPRWWPLARTRQAVEVRHAADWAEAPGCFGTFDEVSRRAPYPRRLTFLR